MVDINLGHGPSFKLAEALKRQGIPFVFVTGYDPDVVPEEFRDVERLQKPLKLRSVVEAVSRLVNDNALEVLPKAMVDADTKWFLTPTGRFVEGGPKADAGLLEVLMEKRALNEVARVERVREAGDHGRPLAWFRVRRCCATSIASSRSY